MFFFFFFLFKRIQVKNEGKELIRILRPKQHRINDNHELLTDFKIKKKRDIKHTIFLDFYYICQIKQSVANYITTSILTKLIINQNINV